MCRTVISNMFARSNEVIKKDNNTTIGLYIFIGLISVVRIGLLLFPKSAINDGEEVWN
jgi:hypothetical protein